MQKVFRPALGMFDVLIHLDPQKLARKHEHLDYPEKAPKPIYGNCEDTTRIPVIEFDPAQLYLEELRVSNNNSKGLPLLV